VLSKSVNELSINDKRVTLAMVVQTKLSNQEIVVPETGLYFRLSEFERIKLTPTMLPERTQRFKEATSTRRSFDLTFDKLRTAITNIHQLPLRI
jgi:hypothetical protein